MDYRNFDEQGRFKPEYVDVYGIPFSVIPFKGRPVKHREDGDEPVNHVRALPERAQVMEMRFPVVEGYVFALKKNLIRCDVGRMEATTIEPDRTPTAKVPHDLLHDKSCVRPCKRARCRCLNSLASYCVWCTG